MFLEHHRRSISGMAWNTVHCEPMGPVNETRSLGIPPRDCLKAPWSR